MSSEQSGFFRKLDPKKLLAAQKSFISCLFVALIIIPLAYQLGWISIETVNMLGRYMTFAIIAIGLDLVWGYTGILSLCQALFFCLGGYAMGMYLAHHGGPEGITDRLGWKIPACLYVVYPYEVGEVPQDAMVPWFWKPFWNLPVTVLLGLLIPGLTALVIGFFGFRSRVRGVYFAILTQAIAVAAFLFFQRNEVKFCGTNGLTRFVQIASTDSITSFKPFNLIPNERLRGTNSWALSADTEIKRNQGLTIQSPGTHTAESFLQGPLNPGTEHTLLVTASTTNATPIKLVALNKSGNTVTNATLTPIRLRGTSNTEYRADFIPGEGVERIRYEISSDSTNQFLLSKFKLFPRYNSASGGFTLSNDNVQFAFYILTVLALAAIFLICKWITNSKFGRVLIAVRDDETSLRFFGYRPWVYKLGAFVAAGMFAGLGGMLYVPQMKIITPYDMEAGRSILVVIWVAVGGRGTLSGAILGAISVNLLYNYFTSEHDYGFITWKAEYWQFILGALFIGVVLGFPNGLVRLLDKVKKPKPAKK